MQITLANLKEATAKQVFDQVKTHLLKQNTKSLNDRQNCSYRGDGGLMCAAGCLISDAEYAEINANGVPIDDGSGKNWGWLVDNGHVPKAHERLISELQVLHDHNEPSQWPKRLERFEITHDLED